MISTAELTNYLTAFSMGLLGNLHCLGMCGSIAATLGSAQSSTPYKGPIISLALNIGRILSYLLMGMFMGSLGFIAQYQFGLLAGKVIRIFAAVVMIAFGLYLTRHWMGLLYIEKIGAKLWAKIAPFTQRCTPINSIAKGLSFGMLWGLLPCGLIYSALIWAMSSQSSLQGGLIMLAFGLGTLPGLLTVSIFSQQLLHLVRRHHIHVLAGFVMIGLASWNLYTMLIPASHASMVGHHCH